ncbi:hypothetical protein BN59_03108 [Legionella massiliensis]|uniref:Uncharacterized protein n=1 Tax=Legionella massiliensis TaxID=1034943 RepID=A0A078L3T6_9GAMM|nr:hypothetical protein [Legionella massiliensis]CDZ78794.1 hypothetical protein BN59_03108 [Legionella massiliensis]CEE14532.1 hypothetical protein BN1094_03108 [Legionella massiliensis]
MQFIDLAVQVIPGYDLLEKNQKDAFEQTEAGRLFKSFVSKFLSLANPRETNSSAPVRIIKFGWSLLSGKLESERSAFWDQFSKEKTDLFNSIKGSRDYEALINRINYELLKIVYPDFLLLTPPQQSVLTKAPFSMSLYSSLLPLMTAQAEEQKKFDAMDQWQKGTSPGMDVRSRLEELEEEKEKIIKEWTMKFQKSAKMAPLRERIAEHRAPERASALARALPILNNTLPPSERSMVELYIEEYKKENRKAEPDLAKMEVEFLTSVIFHHLQNASLNHINFLNLQNFNHDQAKEIAKKILKAIAKDRAISMASWLEEYEDNLNRHVERRLRLINGKIRKIVAKAEEKSGMLSSLSYLFWHSAAVNKTTEFFDKLADAHAFIQYTGMSTQNESSYLVIVDLYNYYRSAGQITETRTILFSLLKPFMPLYEEYKEIGLYEKNVYRKIFRTVMPLLVIAGFVVLVAAMLSPLAIPELAFLIAAIPTLFLGIFLASKYVTIKNELHQYFRTKYYGGAFEIPEFKINPRMLHIFGSEENAEVIRAIYINELKACDELEKSYSERGGDGLLTEEELKLRKDNIIRRHSILLEWYDIHSNNELGFEKVPKIVEKRLTDIADEETKLMEKDINEHDLQKARRCVARIVSEAKAALIVEHSHIMDIPVNPGTTSTSTLATDESSVSERPARRTRETRARVETSVSSSSDSQAERFFKPKSLKHQKKATEMEQALGLLEMNPLQLQLSVS